MCNCWSCLVLTCRFDRIYISGDIAIFRYRRFGMKLPIHVLSGIWGHFFPNVPVVLTAKKLESRSSRYGLRARRTEKNRTVLEVTNRLYFICSDKTSLTKICRVVKLSDIILCATFQNEIFKTYYFTVGQISVYLLIFAWVSRHYSAALIRRPYQKSIHFSFCFCENK